MDEALIELVYRHGKSRGSRLVAVRVSESLRVLLLSLLRADI